MFLSEGDLIADFSLTFSTLFRCVGENIKARGTVAPRTASTFSVETIVQDGQKADLFPQSF